MNFSDQNFNFIAYTCYSVLLAADSITESNLQLDFTSVNSNLFDGTAGFCINNFIKQAQCTSYLASN